MHTGMLYAIGAYISWGILPIYFKLLLDVPADQIVINRIVWSLAFLGIVIATRGQWAWLRQAFRQPRVLAGFTASALLLSCNWFLYVWSVNNGHIVDASLGYFINPLFNVLLGFVILHERLRPGQWAAITLAALGVAWLTWQSGTFPWIAIMLAFTFGTYGLLRKTATLGALEGLSLETLMLFPFALIYLLVISAHGKNAFTTVSPSSKLLLIAAGPITAVPLLMFAAGARRMPLSVLGVLQYISPTLQLLTGVLLYDEPFGGARLIGFAFIWSALALFSLEGLWRNFAGRQSRRL